MPDQVLVPVVEVSDIREISNRSERQVERLLNRIEDIRAAIASGAAAIASGLEDLTAVPSGWGVDEVKGTFGISLAAEADAIITSVSAQASFQVEVTFKRVYV